MRKYKGKLKMFVWDEFLTDWTSGLAVAVAETVEEARAMVRAEYLKQHGCESNGDPYGVYSKSVDRELEATPTILPLQSCVYCYGGS